MALSEDMGQQQDTQSFPVQAQRLSVRLPLRGTTGVGSMPSAGRKMEKEEGAHGICPDPRNSRQDKHNSLPRLGMQKLLDGGFGCSVSILVFKRTLRSWVKEAVCCWEAERCPCLHGTRRIPMAEAAAAQVRLLGWKPAFGNI